MTAKQPKSPQFNIVQKIWREVKRPFLRPFRKMSSRIAKLETELKNVTVRLSRITPQASIGALSIQITRHCNLNCRFCGTFSPLAESEFVSLDVFEKDIKRLSELTLGYINTIAIVGGEPLLHPDCIKFLEITRKYFPDSIVNLITNGILLPRQNDNFYRTCAENNIVIAPTKYPIKVDWDKVQADCKKHSVKFEFISNTEKEVKTMWLRVLDLAGKQDPRKSFMNCQLANSCIQLVSGKLCTCCVPTNIRHFNKYFNKNLVTTELDYIDIHKAKDYNEILTFLAKPIPFCKYCKATQWQYELEWQPSKKVIEEWT